MKIREKSTMMQQCGHCGFSFYIEDGHSCLELSNKVDNVNHPKHYTSHPSGIECIQVARHMSFNLGNALKYLWRSDLKGGVEDLEKAVWYLQDEIKRRKKSDLRVL